MKKWSLVAIIVFLIFLMGAGAGYQLRRGTYVCPEPSIDTVLVVDTVTVHIPIRVPYYIIKRDTIVYVDSVLIHQAVDTALILREYFSENYFTRTYSDSTIWIEQKDMVTKNTVYAKDLKYKILRPQTVIINRMDYSVTYSSYITLGGSLLLSDPDYYAVEATYINDKFYGGVSYYPGIKGVGVKFGAPVVKFKTSKK